MDILERLKLRLGDNAPDDAVLEDYIEQAKNIYLSRRYPFIDPPTVEVTTEVDGEEVTTQETYVESRYLDWQYRCALMLYNKDGADGQTSHSENGISRSWGSESVPKELLSEIPPFVGVPR